jgi:hypothetical protein
MKTRTERFEMSEGPVLNIHHFVEQIISSKREEEY